MGFLHSAQSFHFNQLSRFRFSNSKISPFPQITVGRHLIPPLSNFVFSLTFVVQRSLVNVLFSISNSIHDVLTTSLYILYKSRLLNLFSHSFSNVLKKSLFFFSFEEKRSILSQTACFIINFFIYII